jgi:hypothetical protein
MRIENELPLILLDMDGSDIYIFGNAAVINVE